MAHVATVTAQPSKGRAPRLAPALAAVLALSVFGPLGALAQTQMAPPPAAAPSAEPVATQPKSSTAETSAEAAINPVPRPGAPQSFADLADHVMPAVVNISASTRVEVRNRTLPQLPQGTPFEDLFEDFFNRRGGGNNNNGEAPRPRRSNSLGSGFVIDPSGIVVTNNHVIGDADDIEVIFGDGMKLKAEVIGKDAKVDLAVLKVKSDKPLKFVTWGNSDDLRIGDWVAAIGNPFGLGGSITAGILSARGRDIGSGAYDDYLQTDAAINKGNSGGPLFNMRGEVVGINTAILSPTGGSVGIGFAVPAGLASPIIDQLRQYGETRRGWLGVRIQNVDDATADALGLKEARGALVAGVDDQGPAKPAGIEVGDVIVRFDNRDVKESRDLPRIVAQTPVGKTVDVTIVRKGAEVKKSVTIGRLDETEAKRQASLSQPADTPTVTRQALGLNLSGITDELRRRFNLKDTVKGVVVTRVDPNSAAADNRIQPGDILVEVGQEPVSSPADVTRRIDTLRKQGRKSALLLLTNAQGEVRFVALAIDSEQAKPE